MNKYSVRVRREVAEETTIAIWAEDENEAMEAARKNVSSKDKWDSVSIDPHYEVVDLEEIDLGGLLVPALYAKGWERLHTGGGCWSLLWQIEPDGPYYLLSDQDSGIEIYEKEWSFGHYDAEGCQTWFVTSDQFPALTLTEFLASLNLPEREPNQYELGGSDDDASS